MSERELGDDELVRMLRALDPATRQADAGPEHDAERRARQERVWAQVRDRIEAEPGRRRRARRARLWWGFSLPAVAVALVALVVVLVANPFAAPTPAAAEGLPPLRYAASDLTLSDHLDGAREKLAATPGPAEPVRASTTVAWYAHITMDGADRGTVISPEVVTITWDENLDMRIRVTAGRAYAVGGADEQPPTREDLATPGSVLRDDEIDGEMNVIEGVPLPFLVAGDGLDFYRQYLADTVAAYDGGAGEALQAVAVLLDHWTMTNAQEADLLTALSEFDGFKLRGVATDRAGREVFGLSAVNAAGTHEEVLLVSTENGRILGSETVYLAEDPDVPLPTGSVMSYRMWDLADPYAE